uniref:Uncharacterized protein n=1 Tax=Anopheles quadriannulatus TaxID=34691 RepID=A0A182XRR7_ANOQN
MSKRELRGGATKIPAANSPLAVKSQPPVENKSPHFFVDASLGCSSIVMSTFPS